MEFSHFLSSYYPDTSYPAEKLFADMLQQARQAEALGYSGVTIPEHHFINILMNPAPLQMAVKVASETSHINITTAVLVLPFHDIKRLAGEIAVADILCDGRVILGLGRGAFDFEFRRFGITAENSRGKFDESLEILRKLLTETDVGWDGKYYQFEPLTIMPRPLTKPMPQMMIAALAPEAIYHSARRGFHVQTTPLQGDMSLVQKQVDAFRRGKAESTDGGHGLRLSMLRVCYVAANEKDARHKQELAHGYFQRFDNMFTGPGIVNQGAIRPLSAKLDHERLAANIIIGTVAQVTDKLARYHDLGIDEINLNANIGATQEEVLSSMQRLAEEILPSFQPDDGVKAV